ncbi:MAG: DM13 domain-containing protein, partial [Myxococcota bacterium]
SPEPEPTRTAVREASLVADGAGGAPDATGTVRIERDATGGLYVALADDFAQEMGPGDTQLILARTGDNIQSQRDADAESTSMSLGTIPNGASGERAFALPSDVDLDDFDYAVIWCPTAGVNFGVAQLPLRAGQLAGDGPGNAPDASGGIAISRGADNALTIELADDFMQEMGPGDTQLILAKGDGNVNDQRTMAASNASDSLGTITNGASGSQSFAVPDDVDLDQFDYAIIWCPTAGVNFGVAELN